VDVEALLSQLAADGPLLIEAADRAGWDAAVPATSWDVRTLVKHVGGVHRWAADIVDSRSTTFDTRAGQAVGSGPEDDELVEWFHNGFAALLATLSSAAPDLECCTFLPADSPRHFWARRQAHETAVHRADAQGAANGVVEPFEAPFAQDGIAELLHGFARRKANASGRRATIGLDAADGPCWLITLGGERTDAVEQPDVGGTNVLVRGLSSDLYLWLWNRPSDAIVDGDAELAGLWKNTVRVRWS
jgi:uncharacterized protein (TIGR03083 family)